MNWWNMQQMKPFGLVLFLCFSYLPLLLGQVSFKVFVDAKQIVLNSYLEVSFTLKNADGSNFKAPAFNGFSILSGPSSSSSTTIINGQVSKELSYNYTLKPKQVGKYRIGSASVNVKGKKIRTKPITVEVLPASSKASGLGDAEVYVKAVPNTTEALVGQQIVLDYKLYTTIDIDNYNILEESAYQGFFAKDIKRYDFRVVREVIDGKQFVTKVIKRVALFPQQAGLLEIDPMQLQMGIVVNENKQRRSFFFNKQVKRLPVETEAVQINVQPLPPNPPASFSGAVGDYDVLASIQRSTITTDDVLSLRLSISGNGDIKRVQAPKIEFPPSFEVYDPKVLDETTIERNEGIIGKKVIEYLALPREAGTYEIQTEFSYYSPDSAKYVLNREGNFQLTVRQGANKPNVPILETETQERQEDIRHIKTASELRFAPEGFFASTLFWILTVVPFLALGGVLIAKQFQQRLSNLDPALLKSKRARKVAQQRLANAKQLMEANNSRGFYDEISKAMLGYVCSKLQIPLSELTKENVREKLEVLNVENTLVERFMKLIKTTEMALFAGKDNPEAMANTYKEAVEVVANIEGNLT